MNETDRSNAQAEQVTEEQILRFGQSHRDGTAHDAMVRQSCISALGLSSDTEEQRACEYDRMSRAIRLRELGKTARHPAEATTRAHVLTPSIMQGHDFERDPSASANVTMIEVRGPVALGPRMVVRTSRQARQLAYQLLEAADEVDGWRQGATPIPRGT